ncbi:MAG: anti-sigma factor domain-containing protein [Bacillota bacterium]|nr:anti-sigma factor domain-containing protein [Bacillota bacterium]
MSKGTILEIENDKVLVMTGECDFIYIKRKSGMFVGQQVQYVDRDTKIKNRQSNWLVPVISSVAAIFVIISSYFIFFHKNSVNPLNDTFAFVDIDINPSIEFMLDDSNKVIKAVPLNKDAEKVIKGAQLDNIYLEKAITNFIAKSDELGFIQIGKNYLLATVSLNDEYKEYGKDTQNQKSSLDKLEETLNIALEDKTDKFKVNKVSPIIKKKASKNNLSMGRQLYFDNLKKSGNEISIDEARNEDVSIIIDNLDGSSNESGDTKTKSPNSTSSPTGIKTNTASARVLTTPTIKPNSKNTPTKPAETKAVEKVVYDDNIMDLSGKIKGNNIVLNWTPIEGANFQYYKIVISKNNSKPKYPDDGYLYAISDINTSSVTIGMDSKYNGGDFGERLIPGARYYFSITSVFKDKKVYSNTIAFTCPKTAVNTTKPSVDPNSAPKLTAKVESNGIALSWTPNTREGFVYYKVVISKDNPHPKYPEDGYMWYSEKDTSYMVESSNGYNGGDFDGKLVSGQKYYFSITYVYNDKKISSNTLYLTYP